MTRQTTDRLSTDSTDTQMHDLGTTLNGVGLFLGLTLGLVLVMGYSHLAVAGAGLLLVLH